MKYNISVILASISFSAIGASDQSAAPYLPCTYGPGIIQMMEVAENKKQTNNKIPKEYEYTLYQMISKRHDLEHVTEKTTFNLTSEETAEYLIRDCSQQLAVMSAIASMEDGGAAKMGQALWKENLDYMKWWLQNKHSKEDSKK